MLQSEIEQVLENWIKQAISPTGKLAEGITPAEWVSKNFIHWWRSAVEDSLGDAESAARRLRLELRRLGDSERMGEAFHELTHVEDALADLNRCLGFSPDDSTKT